MLTAASRLGERCHVGFAEFTLGIDAYNHGDYAGAAAAHTRAAAALEAVGPVSAASAATAAMPHFLVLVSLPSVLHFLGIALKNMDDTARAERAYLQSLAAHKTWGDATAARCDAAGMPRVQSQRQQNCAHLASLYRDTNAKSKLAARLRMWRALMEEEGIACPGDSDAWLQYAQVTATTAEEALDVAARARRVYTTEGIFTPVQRTMRFRDAQCAASGVLAQLGDVDSACALGMEAVADAGRAGPDAWRVQADALHSLARRMKPADDGHLRYDAATEARRLACLRLCCRAAALFPAPARHGITYVDRLYAVEALASSEFYERDGADVTLPDAEFIINLPHGGTARLSDPLGRGFIELSHAILQALEALHGAQSPQLVERLRFHSGRCLKYGDLIAAVDFGRRHVSLCTAVFGARHAATQEAETDLDNNARCLATVLRRMPADTLESPDARCNVQLMFAACLGPGGAAAVIRAESDEVFSARKVQVERASIALRAAVKGAARPQRFACAGCGALPAPGAPAHQKCAACMAVTYCGPACQRAHWRAHRKDCKLLRKHTEQPAAAAASS
jgi:hypothetical protein